MASIGEKTKEFAEKVVKQYERNGSARTTCLQLQTLIDPFWPDTSGGILWPTKS